jgi:Tol biopolymer transport system component
MNAQVLGRKLVGLTAALGCAALAVLAPQAKFLMAGEGHYVALVGYVDYTVHISVAYDDVGGDGESDDPDISGNGRRVVFHSESGNLVAGGTLGTRQVYLRDRDAQSTSLISADSVGAEGDGPSGNAVISDNGNYIAYQSEATNLLGAGNDTNAVADVFVYNRLSGVTTLVSVDSAGNQATGHSWEPALSADGSVVVFSSVATDLLSPGIDSNGVADVFVRHGPLTERVSVSSTGAESNDESRRPAVSGNGTLVVFESNASNLIAGDANTVSDVFLRNRVTGTTIRLSEVAGVGGDDGSFDAAISADGSTAAFISRATNLVSGDNNAQQDVFVVDLGTGTIERVNTTWDGGEADGYSRRPSLSADGRYVVFDSVASNLVPGPNYGGPNVYVHDRVTRITERVSLSVYGGQGDARSRRARISADGTTIAFESDARLLPTDVNDYASDVYAFDRTALQDKPALNGLVVNDLGQPLDGIVVSLSRVWTGDHPIEGTTWGEESVAWAQTDHGWFSIQPLLGGPYALCALDPTAVHALACWPGSAVASDIALITAERGSSTAGWGLVMPRAGSISGNVTDGNVDPVSDLEIELYQPDSSGDYAWVYGAEVNVSETAYTISGIAPGPALVCFSAPGYAGECYDDAPLPASWNGGGTDVTVAPGAVVPNIDAVLERSGSIAGTVTDHGGAHPSTAST